MVLCYLFSSQIVHCAVGESSIALPLRRAPFNCRQTLVPLGFQWPCDLLTLQVTRVSVTLRPNYATFSWYLAVHRRLFWSLNHFYFFANDRHLAQSSGRKDSFIHLVSHSQFIHPGIHLIYLSSYLSIHAISHSSSHLFHLFSYPSINWFHLFIQSVCHNEWMNWRGLQMKTSFLNSVSFCFMKMHHPLSN